jgi:hypothetical protein
MVRCGRRARIGEEQPAECDALFGERMWLSLSITGHPATQCSYRCDVMNVRFLRVVPVSTLVEVSS